MSTVVIGAGVVGLTAAYYLSQEGHKVTIVEKCAVACHSSGKAGGFLTDGDSGWHTGPVAKLAKHSFALHEQLAKDLGTDKIGYRRVRCFGRSGRGQGGAVAVPAWLTPGQYERDMGDESGLAQLTPYKLMDALHSAVVARGCEVVIGKVVGMNVEDQAVKAVKLEQNGEYSLLPCTAVILGMGAWAQEAAAWFPGSAMPKDTVSNRYTSVIWNDIEVGKSAAMVFTMAEDGHTEIYPRDNECYANGCPTSPELPDNPLEIVPPPEEVEMVKAESIAAVARLKDATVIRTTACFLAGSDDGHPVVGMVPEMKNAVIACGGGCWGILNGPAMGQAAAALVMGEEPKISLTSFDPARFGCTGLGVTDFGGIALPQKLRALALQNPQLAEMLRENPQAVLQLIAAMEQDST